jgi:hypothetical protein
MATGLFETPAEQDGRSPAGGPIELDDYRALSGAAIAAAVLAALSPLAFFGWWLAAVPAIGLAVAVVALRDIAGRPRELTGRPLAFTAAIVSVLTLVGGLAWQSLVYSRELPPGFERLGYAQLQPAEGDPPLAVPQAALALDGRDVLLKGYMYPGKQQLGIAQFLLVRDQGDCCFGGNPKITDRVLVQLSDASGIAFTPRLVKIAGRFAVRPMGFAAGAEGGVLYHLEDAQVR